MTIRSKVLGTVILTGLMTASALAENTFKFAFQGTLKSLDPYSLNETFTVGTLINVYEGLTRLNPELRAVPALAESWGKFGTNRWRFKLRRGVKFHNGNDFTADDVVFSADRVRAEGSNLKTKISADTKFVKIDNYTVDVIQTGPIKKHLVEWATWAIIDKEWAEANNSVKITSASNQSASLISLSANGTGAFKLVSHEAGIKTLFEANSDWWDISSGKHNLDKVEFSTISSDATRVAALLSGEMDMVYPIPVQDIKRIIANATTTVMEGSELRTIFLGMDQRRDELLESSIKGKNPFKDVRVRKAFYHAIDIETIKSKVMRNLATPAALMISPRIFDNAGQFTRLEYSPDGAKALLTEAGYPDGFEVGMDCPNDRYVNDDAICQAIVSMLAKIGIKVNLNSQPKAQYFAKVLASGGFNTSFYLLGWTPASFDSLNVLSNLHRCRDDKGNGGLFNLGGFCNEKVDELIEQIQVEDDSKKRLDLITQAYKITIDNVNYIPLHQQNLAWGVSQNTKLVQRDDNQLMLYYVKKK